MSDAATVAVRSLTSVLKLFFLEGKLIGVCSLADFDEALGLITCEEVLFSHSAKQRTTPWIGAGITYSRLQRRLCQRWRGTKGRKWVRHVEERSYPWNCSGFDIGF